MSELKQVRIDTDTRVWYSQGERLFDFDPDWTIARLVYMRVASRHAEVPARTFNILVLQRHTHFAVRWRIGEGEIADPNKPRGPWAHDAFQIDCVAGETLEDVSDRIESIIDHTDEALGSVQEVETLDCAGKTRKEIARWLTDQGRAVTS